MCDWVDEQINQIKQNIYGLLMVSVTPGVTSTTTPFICQPEEPVVYVARKGQPTRSLGDYILIGSKASKQADVDKLNSPTSKCTEYNRRKEVRAGEVRR
jgi:hypothetical protein